MGKLFWTFINKINAVRNLKSLKKIGKSKTEKLMAVAQSVVRTIEKNSSEQTSDPLSSLESSESPIRVCT